MSDTNETLAKLLREMARSTHSVEDRGILHVAAKRLEQEGSSEVKGLASSRANTPLPAPDGGWQPMESAPKDGTKILIKFRHQNWQYEKTPEGKARWEENCFAKWIDHNDGGWTWHGIAGQPIGWLPLPSPSGEAV